MLSAKNTEVFLPLGETALRYRLDAHRGHVDFLPLPASLAGVCVPKDANRPFHPTMAANPARAWNSFEKDPLVQVALRGQPLPGAWCAGRTSRNSPAALSLRFSHQEIHRDAAGCRICTTLDSPLGFRATHTARWHTGAGGFLIETTLTNISSDPIEVEMLSSFSLSGLTPFVPDDAHGCRLGFHYSCCHLVCSIHFNR